MISCQSALSISFKIISINQMRHVNIIVEEVVTKAKEANAIMTVASGSVTRTNPMEGVIKTITVITLEKVLKTGDISGCATASARNVYVIITTPQFFILCGSMIQ